ncbi:MAG TPA: six-cysteine ranthipeptide SCIFF [Bacillota bacterium]|nr:six-cysteine ranthipeptide SCIFF [Bacillota bacterium]
MGKHIKTINTTQPLAANDGRGCGECQASCQSACKTSCTVGNQVCLKSLRNK